MICENIKTTEIVVPQWYLVCHKQVKTVEKVPLGLRKWRPQALNRGWPLNTVPLNTGSTVFIYIKFKKKKNQTVVTGNNGQGPLQFQSPQSPYPWSWATPTKKEEIISDISRSSSFSVTKNFKWSIHLENCGMLTHYNFGITKTRCFCPGFLLVVCCRLYCLFLNINCANFHTLFLRVSLSLYCVVCIVSYLLFFKKNKEPFVACSGHLYKGWFKYSSSPLMPEPLETWPNQWISHLLQIIKLQNEPMRLTQIAS